MPGITCAARRGGFGMSGAEPTPSVHSRRAARLAAVQALYQMELAGSTPAGAVQDVLAGHLPRHREEGFDGDVDVTLFTEIVELAVERQDEVDTIIAKRLASGWRLERIDAVARAALRAGVLELWARPDIPVAVTIGEYVEIAKSFFSGPEPGFINATLDRVARALRPPAPR